MTIRGRRSSIAAVLLGVALVVFAAPATAEPFDVEAQDDLEIDLTTGEDPTLDLRLQRSAEMAPAPQEVVLTLKARTPLGPACDFVARSGLPTAAGATAVVRFTVRSAHDCDLATLDVDKVTLSSTAIDDTNITAQVKKKPAFPLDKYGRALAYAAAAAALIVMSATMVAWVGWWAGGDREDDRFWAHPLDSPTLKWSFNDSWLTNLTALGALLATLLGLTDVLAIIGPPKPDRAVFLLVNFAGVALAASALIAYQALRGYTFTTKKTAQVPLRLEVRACPSENGRQLRVEVPTINYTVDGESRLARQNSLDPPITKVWTNSGHHVAVVAVTAAVSSGATVPPPPPALVSLEVPAAGNHAPKAVLLYDTSVPMLGSIKGATYAPAITKESRTKPHGRMVGFVAAGLLASVGVSIQLASMYKVLDRSSVSSGARQAGTAILAVLVAAAVVYVVATILTRLSEVEAGEPKVPSATAALQVHGPDVPTDANALKPVVASAVLNVTDASDVSTLADILATAPAAGAVTYPMPPYAGLSTSPGDEVRDMRRLRGETAF